MFDKVKSVKQELRSLLEELDPERLSGSAAAALVEDSAEIERLGAALKALASRRVADSGIWRKGGQRSAAHWLAGKTGVSVGQAVSTIETAKRLTELPATEAAVREGRLSETQTKEIASAAAADPEAENKLLGVAAKEGVATLRQECARVKAAASDDDKSRYAAIHKNRYLRHWSDAGGAFRLEGRFTPDAGAVVVAALEPYRDEVFKEARKQGRREPYDAYGADALVALAEHARTCDSTHKRNNPGTLVRVLVDHDALERGHTENGEVCEIEGIGPIPVATAQALARDSILAALSTDGTDIYKVSHLGRTITARQRTALEVRDPVCCVIGCDVRDHLQIDHIAEVHELGPTHLANLRRLCPWHHHLRTYKRFELVEADGGYLLVPPGGAGPDPPTDP